MSTATQNESRAQTNEHRPQRQEFVAPDVNIFETKDGYVLEAELPGVNKDGLEITVENNELTIVTSSPGDRPGRTAFPRTQ